ncbi:MAG: hypothetical protein R8G01_17375 [Ilumatobacteraceae bacterium]|nr:hypothetical protein [Ilumatobacteraceae bacterium]
MAGRVGQTLLAAATVVASVGAVPATSDDTPANALATSAATAYAPVGPLRLADTRERACGCTRLDASTLRVDIVGRPGIAPDATAVAVTVTALPTSTPAFVTAYPGGADRPLASTLNTRTDRVTSNSTIVPVGDDGAIELFQLVPGELVVDVSGVFVRAESSRSGRLVSVTTRRLVDTRTPAGGAKPLGRNGDLTIPLPAGVDPDATALAVNVTSVGDPAPGYLSVRPAGTPVRTTSFMNLDGSGQATAASLIAPVSPAGLTIRSLTGGHVIVDLTGWFTGPTAADTTDGLFHPLSPTRLLDTRIDRPRLHPGGAIELPIDAHVPGGAAASVVTNVTVTDADRAGFVTAYPAGAPRPATSAVNPAFWNHTIANTAITRVGDRGLAYWSLAGTDLVVDLAGWFAGASVAATTPPPPNTPTRSRVMLVGDSTLAGIDVYTDSWAALRGFDSVIDAESCRRLLRPSCFSNVTYRTPNTAVEAILGTPGTLDIVVVKAGYNDWFSDFPREFDAVVDGARAKGAHTIVWFTQNETVRRDTARRAYQENNVDLRRLTTLPQYTDVVLADWFEYSDGRQDWFHDGTHVTRAGAYAITDYVARWIAALEHRPCPRPWTVGAPIPDPCPAPDLIGPVPDPIGVTS